MQIHETAYIAEVEPVVSLQDNTIPVDAAMLRELSDDIPKLEAMLRQLQSQEKTTEEAEAERAKTPLALQLSVISCEFASMTFPDKATIPDYQFAVHPCVYGKTRPDQDCRLCNHVQILPYGNHLPSHEQRYSRHGMVIPIRDESQSEQVTSMLSTLELKPLRRPSLEIHKVQQALNIARRRYIEMNHKG